jgi:hypothetical protein
MPVGTGQLSSCGLRYAAQVLARSGGRRLRCVASFGGARKLAVRRSAIGTCIIGSAWPNAMRTFFTDDAE